MFVLCSGVKKRAREVNARRPRWVRGTRMARRQASRSAMYSIAWAATGERRMAENKTKPTGADVGAFLDAVPDPKRRADAKEVCAMMERLSGEPPKMWGPSIVGFGRYRYQYESGHKGEAARIGFSPRARELVLYLLGDFTRQ